MTNYSKEIVNRNKSGRPTKMTVKTVTKLETAFAYGATDEQACFFAGISRTALHNYEKQYPDFRNRKQDLKEKPVLKALKIVYQSLDDVNVAKWFLERKHPEFMPKSKSTLEGGLMLGHLIKKTEEENKTKRSRDYVEELINGTT